MFNDIAPWYDFLNHFLSFGIDRMWRRKVINRVASSNPRMVLDVATGTADLAIGLARRNRVEHIVGIDIAESMLELGREKVQRLNLSPQITLLKADSLSLPFGSSTFDAAMVAFGVRNFEDVAMGLREIRRVLRSGGKLHILEFSMPRRFPMRWLYRFYFRVVLPILGRAISGHRSAYSYLPQSVEAFPQGSGFTAIMHEAGFSNCNSETLSFGIATIYEGTAF